MKSRTPLLPIIWLPTELKVEVNLLYGYHLNSSQTRRRLAIPSGVYISSPAFAAAPINSRVPPVSPHRTLPNTSSSRSRPLKPLATTAESYDPVRYTTPAEAELSDGSEEPEEYLGIDLNDLDTDLQEAVIIEDLLYVLLVSTLVPFALSIRLNAGPRASKER